MRLLPCMVCAVVVVGCGSSDLCSNSTELDTIALANGARDDEGLGTLSCDEDLTEAARLHSEDMCTQGYFSHTSADGRTLADRLNESGVDYNTGGENIAKGHLTPAQVHEGWMNSPGHRANILRDTFGRIGVGYIECDGSPVWTQVFAN